MKRAFRVLVEAPEEFFVGDPEDQALGLTEALEDGWGFPENVVIRTTPLEDEP